MDCITTFDTEKSELCMPAGRPILRISRSSAEWILSDLNDRRQALFMRLRWMIISRAERYCEIIVGIATPLTPNFSTMTKKRFSATFTSPENVRIYSGRLVSPVERTIAAPKL